MNAFETSLGISTIELFKQFLKKKLDEEENKKERHQFVKTLDVSMALPKHIDQKLNEILESHKDKHIKIIKIEKIKGDALMIVFEEDE